MAWPGGRADSNFFESVGEDSSERAFALNLPEKAGFRGPASEESERLSAFATEVRDEARATEMLGLQAKHRWSDSNDRGGGVSSASRGVHEGVYQEGDRGAFQRGFAVTITGIVARDGTPIPAMPEPTAVATVAISATVEEIVCSQPWPCQEALTVAFCESSLNPRAHNRSSDALGLFQLLRRFHEWRFAGGDPFDAEVNVRAAFGLWQEQSWGPWIVGGCSP